MFNRPARVTNNVIENEAWKSQAFINIYLPTKEGKRRKLGSIGLKVSRPAEKQLIDYLAEDPSRIGQLLARAEVDFQLAEGSEETAFDLSAGQPADTSAAEEAPF
jgi:hypothetical protein